MIKRFSCIAPINSLGEVLLQKKTADYIPCPGAWTFFGGQIEDGEAPMEAAKRELKEELGIQSDLIFITDKKVSFKNDIHHIYLYKILLDSLGTILIGEGSGVAYFSKKEISGLCLNSDAKKLIPFIFKD